MADLTKHKALLNAFRSALPQFGPPDSDRYTIVSASGTTTKFAIPPVLLKSGPATPLLDLAEYVLCHEKVLDQIRPNNNLLQIQNPVLKLVSEQDVVLASSIHILAEILAILNILYPKRWGCRSEATNASLSQAGNSSVSVENVRYDLVFYALDKKGNAAGTIAVLEYKKTDIIDFKDFEDALKSKDESQSDLDAFKKSCGSNSMLQKNGKTYMKQLSTYARTRTCPHVALFNWQHFLAFVFDLGKNSDPRFTAGAEVDLIWVSETVVNDLVQRQPIRQAMLGWLLRAFRAKLGTWE